MQALKKKSSLKYSRDFCEKVINSIPDAISIIDVKNFRIIDVNQGFMDQLALKKKHIIGKHCYDVTHHLKKPCMPADKPCPLINSLMTGRQVLFEHVHCRADGRKVFVEVSASPIKNEKGEVTHVIHVARNIGSRKQLEEDMIKLKKAVDYSGEAIFLTDRKGIITFINPEFTRLYGWQTEEVVGKITPRILKSGKMKPLDYEAFWKKILSRQVARGEFVNKTKDGRFLNIDGSANPVIDNEGKIVGFLAIQRNITERKKAEARLDYLAYHDVLTGLLNRLLFNDHLGQALTRGYRYKKMVAVMLLDLDHFKNVNDSLGHTIGDLLLKSVANRLKGYVRRMDSVARLGGDEFGFVIPEITNVHGASAVAKKILSSFSKPFAVDGREIHITASIGISLYPANGENVEELVKNADIAMYRAKEAGRNNCKFY